MPILRVFDLARLGFEPKSNRFSSRRFIHLIYDEIVFNLRQARKEFISETNAKYNKH